MKALPILFSLLPAFLAAGSDIGPLDITHMSLEQKIGQLIIAGFDTDNMDENVLSLIHEYKIAGFIFYSRNFHSDAAQLSFLTRRMQVENAANGIPLLMCIDEEGGTVSRIKDQGKAFPPAAALGAGSPERCFETASKIGTILSKAGIHVDFAPVLDVFHKDRSTYFASRAFSSSPAAVALYGECFIRGLLDSGVYPVVKHYPGQGLLTGDAHVTGGEILRDLAWMAANDMAPFETTLSRYQVGVMMNHASYPLIDASGLPASRSGFFMRDRLRTALGFQGVIFIDEIGMKAFYGEDDVGEAAVQSIANGADLLLIGHSFPLQKRIIGSLLSAAQRGVIPPGRIDDSVRRILSLKDRMIARP